MQLSRSQGVILLLAVIPLALGCQGSSPTAPALEPEGPEQASADRRGGGGGKEQGTFALTFSGGLEGAGSGTSAVSKITLPSFPLHVVTFLASEDDGVNQFGECFGNGQGASNTIVVESMRKDPGQAIIRYRFSARQTDGVTAISYKLTVTAPVQSGVLPPPAGGTATATQGEYTLRGYKGSASCSGTGTVPFALVVERLD